MRFEWYLHIHKEFEKWWVEGRDIFLCYELLLLQFCERICILDAFLWTPLYVFKKSVLEPKPKTWKGKKWPRKIFPLVTI